MECLPSQSSPKLQLRLVYSEKEGSWALKNGETDPPKESDDPDRLKEDPRPGYGVAGQFQSWETLADKTVLIWFAGKDWYQPRDEKTKEPKGLGYFDPNLSLSLPYSDLRRMGMLLFDHILRREVHTAIACCSVGKPVLHKTKSTDFNLDEFKAFMAYYRDTHDAWKKAGGDKAGEAKLLRSMLINAIDLRIKVIDKSLEKKYYSALRAGLHTEKAPDKLAATIKVIEEEKKWLGTLKEGSKGTEIKLPK